MITVVLLCWKRFEHFEGIIKYWLRQPKVTQVIVWDNSGTFKTDLPILLINSNKNLGCVARHVAVQFAKNDIIIFCDDDANHKDGIGEDFLKYYDENKILGVTGLKYTGRTLKDSTRFYASHLDTPIQVDYIAANTCMTHRKHCLVDVKKCAYPILLEDIWWQEEAKEMNKDLELYVIPTKKRNWYPEGDDKYAIHNNPKCLEVREKFFKERGLGCAG